MTNLSSRTMVVQEHSFVQNGFNSDHFLPVYSCRPKDENCSNNCKVARLRFRLANERDANLKIGNLRSRQIEQKSAVWSGAQRFEHVSATETLCPTVSSRASLGPNTFNAHYLVHVAIRRCVMIRANETNGMTDEADLDSGLGPHIQTAALPA